MTLILTFRIVNVKYKYGNGKTLCEFQFVGIIKICHRLRDINSRNVHDLDIDLHNVPRSNVNMPIERPHAIFSDGNVNVCLICHRLRVNRF